MPTGLHGLGCGSEDSVLQLRPGYSAWASALLVVATLAPARAQEGEALRFTVRPSRIEGEETLDEKLARRDRFRFICLGCVRAPGTVSDAPFQPIRTLNAPELTRALAPPPPEVLPEE